MNLPLQELAVLFVSVPVPIFQLQHSLVFLPNSDCSLALVFLWNQLIESEEAEALLSFREKFLEEDSVAV